MFQGLHAYCATICSNALIDQLNFNDRLIIKKILKFLNLKNPRIIVEFLQSNIRQESMRFTITHYVIWNTVKFTIHYFASSLDDQSDPSMSAQIHPNLSRSLHCRIALYHVECSLCTRKASNVRISTAFNELTSILMNLFLSVSKRNLRVRSMKIGICGSFNECLPRYDKSRYFGNMSAAQ